MYGGVDVTYVAISNGLREEHEVMFYFCDVFEVDIDHSLKNTRRMNNEGTQGKRVSGFTHHVDPETPVM